MAFDHFSSKPTFREFKRYADKSPPLTYDEVSALRCDEAEADLWATHMAVRDVAAQFYQILVDDGSATGRPFSDLLFASVILLFSYLNSNAIAFDNAAHQSHPHPQTRTALMHWYALRMSGRMEYFVVDWHSARQQIGILSEVLQFNRLPNVLLNDQEDRLGDLQSDLAVIHSLVAKRAIVRSRRGDPFRLDL